jgi:hypothetical protein
MSEQPKEESKCLSCVKNCLGFIFPSLLEGLTHPDQRENLPKRGKKKQQYQRVSNPNVYPSFILDPIIPMTNVVGGGGR